MARSQLTDVVLRERQGRDRGWWEQMRACYSDAAVINLNWYRGDADGFVAASRRQYDAGRRASHRVAPSIVTIRGLRAVVETPVALETRNVVDGVECDLTSRMRLVSQAERHDDDWLLTTLTAIYESDSLAPVIPGQVPELDAQLLMSQRPAYRFLAYVQARIGWPSRDDLPGDDRPETVTTIYADNATWLTDGHRFGDPGSVR